MKLTYGVSSVDIPDDCAAALGYRAILRNGRIDIVEGRVSRYFPTQEGLDALLAWYGSETMSWLDNLALMLRGNDPATYALDEGPFHVRASTQASYGYLYVSVWVDVKEATAS